MPTKPPAVIIDANVAVKWVIPEKYSDHAARLRDDHLDGRIVARAPSLLLLEAASALRKYVLRGILTADQAERALAIIAEAQIELEELDGLLALESLKASLDLGVTPYDAAYLVLARRYSTILYTADERLLANPRVQGTRLARHLHEYTSPGSLHTI